MAKEIKMEEVKTPEVYEHEYEYPPRLLELPALAFDTNRKRVYVSYSERRPWAVYAALKRWWFSQRLVLNHCTFPVDCIHWKEPMLLREEFVASGWTLECAEGIIKGERV